MGEIQGIGDAVLGGAIAGAIEPRTGAVPADGHSRETACLNCGTPLRGDYCHACGQRGHVHRTVTAFLHDLAHGVFHVEGKIWHTLPLLAWRPGELTRRYIDGQRARFVSPIALFLFSVFLMFAVMGWVGGSTNVNADQLKSGLKADVAQSQARLRKIEAAHQRIVAAHGDTTAIDKQLADARDSASLETAIAEGGTRGAAARISDDVPSWLAAPLKRAADNPELLFYKLKGNAYKWSWALIPLSVPFLWLMFPFSRRFQLYDHVVFVTYSLAFMSLLVVLGSAFAFAGVPGLAVALLLVPPIHIFRQLRGAYRLGRWGALWRTMILLSVAAVALILFTLTMVMLGLLD